jgi:hypothetical protein
MISQNGALVSATVRRAGFAKHWHVCHYRPSVAIFQSRKGNFVSFPGP